MKMNENDYLADEESDKAFEDLRRIVWKDPLPTASPEIERLLDMAIARTIARKNRQNTKTVPKEIYEQVRQASY